MTSKNVLHLFELTKKLLEASFTGSTPVADPNVIALKLETLSPIENYEYHLEVAALLSGSSTDALEKELIEECGSIRLEDKANLLKAHFDMVSAMTDTLNEHADRCLRSIDENLAAIEKNRVAIKENHAQAQMTYLSRLIPVSRHLH